MARTMAALGAALTLTCTPGIGSVDNANPQSVSEALTAQDSISVTSYGALCNGTANDANAINAAITAAASMVGGGKVTFPMGKTCGVNSTIQLLPGVTLVGGMTVPYRCGIRWQGDTSPPPPSGPVIKAINVPNVFAGPAVISVNVSNTNTQSAYGITGLVVDASNLANEGVLAQPVNSAVPAEGRLTMRDTCVQAALGDGIYIKNVIAVLLTDNSISANRGFGINLSSGTADFQLTDNYIHGNLGGGLRLADGSTFGRVAGGKIEDNNGYGIYATSTFSLRSWRLKG
jgi:parallel beta-helix repeat protein